jgi:diguanylate cyclase (GGDEF)-like protein
VTTETGVTVGRGRAWSLRREWTRAFAIMLVLLLVAGIGTIAGVRQLIGQFSGTAHQRDRETTVVTALRNDMVDHEQIAHKLLSGQPIDRVSFVRQQEEISRAFTEALQVFPDSNGTRGILLKTQQSWQVGLTQTGLWGDQVAAMHGLRLEQNPIFGASSDGSRGMLDELEQPSLQAMHDGLANGARLERLLFMVLTGLFGLALAVTWHFRRRMTTDLLRPVATMHRGVLKLRAGEFDHRIHVARNDELGELADAFNSMADSLDESHQALTARATHDSLTGLANRATLSERLAASFGPNPDRRVRHDNVLFIDVDDFKDVNDSLGHKAGDDLLVQVAGRLSSCVRSYDLVARLGGDEFAIVVADSDGGSDTIDVAERVLAALRAPFILDGSKVMIGASIGVAQRRPTTADAADLLRQADFAMYMAKGGGKGRYEIFDAKMHGNMVQRGQLKSDLSRAAAAGQLRLDYQPVTELATGHVVGVEALVRWQHPTLGLLGPYDFIPLAEETGDIDAIGCWVLDTATRQVARWRRTIAQYRELWLAVNLSAFQLHSPVGLAGIKRILADPAVDTSFVVLEVTESALAVDVDGGITSLQTLKDSGVRIAVDDFGTGFSSLSTLARLPVDILKIDRSFVSGDDPITASEPMLDCILAMAQRLSLMVIAEGIEETDQMQLLQEMGCAMGQGYLLARPTAPETLERLMIQGRVLQTTVMPTTVVTGHERGAAATGSR